MMTDQRSKSPFESNLIPPPSPVESVESNPIPPSPIESNPIPPPSVEPEIPGYDTADLYRHIQKTKGDSQHPADFVGSSVAACCGSIFFTIILGVSLTLPIVI